MHSSPQAEKKSAHDLFCSAIALSTATTTTSVRVCAFVESAAPLRERSAAQLYVATRLPKHDDDDDN